MHILFRADHYPYWSGWLVIASSIVEVADPELHHALHPYNDLALLDSHGEHLLDFVVRLASEGQWKDWLEDVMKKAASTGATGVLVRLLASWEHSVDNGTLPRGVLMEAARGGSVDILSTLLAAGAGPLVRAVDETSDALYMASRRGHRHFVAKLIEAGAPVDLRDWMGCTALTEAVLFGRKGVTLELLAAGADVNKILEGNSNPVEHINLTPLGIAIQRSNEEMVKVLLEAGADPSKGPKGFLPPHMAASEGIA